MSHPDIHNLILTKLSELAPEADLASMDPTSDIREELDIDSFDFVRFITGLCEILKLDVPEEDYMKLTTLRGAEHYLRAKSEN
jgi:acyl carrier protein